DYYCLSHDSSLTGWLF
nr:immunoglobulin light chain junction region [Macaca mulatta]